MYESNWFSSTASVNNKDFTELKVKDEVLQQYRNQIPTEKTECKINI